MDVDELPLHLAGCSTGGDRVGELALVIFVQKSWQADNVGYIPGPGPGLWVDPPRYLAH